MEGHCREGQDCTGVVEEEEEKENNNNNNNNNNVGYYPALPSRIDIHFER